MKKRVAGWTETGRGVAVRAWEWARGWLGKRLLGLSLGLSVAGLIASVVVMAVDPGWLSGTEVGDEIGRESRSTTIRNLGIVLAGLIALPLAVWRAQVADQQARAAREQAETADADLLNKRYQDGAAMLRNDVLAVRLSGIHALERLATDHPEQYHIEIMKLLCAFVRHPVKDDGAPRGQVQEDVQAALSAIGACHERQLVLEAADKFWLDLHGAHLRKANLMGRNLSCAPWPDGGFASQADMFTFHLGPDFSEVQMQWGLLSWAQLRHANFTRAELAGISLFGADLTNASFHGADLQDAILYKAILSGASFSVNSGLPAKNLKQEQLDDAIADPEKPPKLEGVKDADTGEQLEWRGWTLDMKRRPNHPDGPK